MPGYLDRFSHFQPVHSDIGGEHVLPDPSHPEASDSDDPGINAPRQMPILFPSMEDWVSFCQNCEDIESMDFGLLGSISDEHLHIFAEVSEEELQEEEEDSETDEVTVQTLVTEPPSSELRFEDLETPFRPTRVPRSRSPTSRIRIHENLTTIDLTPRNSSDMFFGHPGVMDGQDEEPGGDEQEFSDEPPNGAGENPGAQQQSGGLFPLLANFIGGGFGFGGHFFAENGHGHAHHPDHFHHH
ncbi:hypothetical protein HDU93_006781, partial [Gonapodya sp. JEL0774]